MPNYSQGKIYKITNDYNDDVYIGSTCESLNTRFHKHKYDSKRDKTKNYPIDKLMNEIGIVRFRIDLIENYPCNDKIALAQRGGHFIRELGTLNKQIAGRKINEWREANTDNIKEKNKEYRLKNIDSLRKYDKERYNTPERMNYVKNQVKEYCQENKDKIKEYQREYRQRKKLEKLEKNNLAI